MVDQQQVDDDEHHSMEIEPAGENENKSKQLVIGLGVIFAVILFANLYEPKPAESYSECWTDQCRSGFAKKAADRILRGN